MFYSDKETLSEAGRLLLVVHGGIGRNIQATSVVRAISEKFTKRALYVIAGCPEVFLKNPHIKKVHNMSKPSYIFDDYFQDNRTIMMNVEPYQHYDYIYRKKHFIECWCDMLDLPMKKLEPEVFFNIAEMDIAKDYLSKFDRRMILIQHQGGKIPEQKNKKSRILAKTGMYRRNLPEHVTQKVVDELIKMGYMVGSVNHENQFLPKGAEHIKFIPRATTALVPLVAGIITIDSYLLHASACFKGVTPTLALWGGTDPRVLGYPWHKNLVRNACPTPMCHRPNSYLFDHEETGFLWDCPHNDICMNYDPDFIIQEFKKLMKEAGNDKREPKGKQRKRTPKADEPKTKEQDHPCGKAGVACPSKGIPAKEVSAGVGAN